MDYANRPQAPVNQAQYGITSGFKDLQMVVGPDFKHGG